MCLACPGCDGLVDWLAFDETGKKERERREGEVQTGAGLLLVLVGTYLPYLLHCTLYCQVSLSSSIDGAMRRHCIYGMGLAGIGLD